MATSKETKKENKDGALIDSLLGDKPKKRATKRYARKTKANDPRTINILTHFLETKKRLPTAKQAYEIDSEIMDIAAWDKAIGAFSTHHVRKLCVIQGKLFTPDGQMVWVQQSSGSLVPARFREDPNLGLVVLP